MTTHKSGFAAIVGRPNVGKSTLLNRVVGQKIAIMSDKAQTTRNKIQGVYTTPDAQIVFIDTPGIHKPKHRLGDFMVETAYSALREVDVTLFMISADQKRGKGDVSLPRSFSRQCRINHFVTIASNSSSHLSF